MGTAKAILATSCYSYEIDKISINQLSIPSYAVWGEKDSWVSLKYYAPFFKKYSNIELFVSHGAVHCPMETHVNIWLNIYIEKVLNM